MFDVNLEHKRKIPTKQIPNLLLACWVQLTKKDVFAFVFFFIGLFETMGVLTML